MSVCGDVTNTVQEESYQSQNPYQVTATLRQTEVSMMCFCKPDRTDNTLSINKMNFPASILGCNLKLITKQNVKNVILITTT